MLVFTAIWFTFAYIPIAHMVWFASETAPGLLNARGAGFRRRHRGAHQCGVAGLVGAYVVGRRIGYGREAMQPHNLPMTFIGAALLWVGWFGFNAGSSLAASDGAPWRSSTP